MKKRLLLFAVLAFVFLPFTACNPNDKPQEPQEEENPEDKTDDQTQDPPKDLVDLTATVPITENWIYSKRPSITFTVENPNDQAVEGTAKVSFSTDLHESLFTLEKTASVPANGTLDIVITPEENFAPGFYRANCFFNKKRARDFYFGVDPFEIQSPPDKQPDYDEFWETARNQLPVLDNDNVKLHLIEKKSTAKCNVYLVEMPSVPDGLEGDPVIVRGYYLEPTDGNPHPVIMHFYGYDTLPSKPEDPTKWSKISCPGGNNGDYAEFYLSHRGQYINARSASKREDGIELDFQSNYGDWFAFNFGDKNSYYYRGAFMDCVQAVRFMATRETSDMKNLFAEGSSQGGALSYAAAALTDPDKQFSAIAPNVAFLGDFPDYFRIVDWPASVAKSNKGSMTDDEMYAFLSYFDTKNLATRINSAVWATSGLMDRTCPPHTNIAPFNNLPGQDKQMNFYPTMTHDYPKTWNSDISKWFKSHMTQ